MTHLRNRTTRGKTGRFNGQMISGTFRDPD
jgi:hypothetical protein